MADTFPDLPTGPGIRPGDPGLIKGLTPSPLAIQRPKLPVLPSVPAPPAPTDSTPK